MTRRRRTILIAMFTLLIACNAVFWFFNFGARVKGTMYHTTEAAQAVIDELTARGLLEMPEDHDEERALYWGAFAGPIQPHIDPFSSLAVYPPLFNMAALVVLAIAVFVPVWGRTESTKPV